MFAFSSEWLNIPGFRLSFGMEHWAVACGMPRARRLVDPFRKNVGSHERVYPRFGKESHHVIGEEYVKYKAEENMEFDGSRSRTLGS